MELPPDYLERVYAGVLGKMIGVYLGRPFEGWTHQQIEAELGEIRGYVNEKFNVPLIVTDDDLSGTFTFLRALDDFGPQFTAEDAGATWLNYIVEEKSVLWWGGMGNSTEHTAYLRLSSGIRAPASGSIELNGKTVAEQIGAQIFIDGWGMVAPGQPQLAADFARRAASASHDGEAVYAAQLLAAIEAQAFYEREVNRLLDTGLSVIPADSLIARLIADVRAWHQIDRDWRLTRNRIEERYGYDRFPGNCHVIPNHAIIILSLLYGQDDFRRGLMIANTCGWDTDCNSGNVGCLLGIRDGLSAFASLGDLREPLADRLYVSTADGAHAITDAVRETHEIVRLGYLTAGMSPPESPKRGARFHFSLPGSLQGFVADQLDAGVIAVSNSVDAAGKRRLKIATRDLQEDAMITTPTFIPPEAKDFSHYYFLANPTLHPGQKLSARVQAAAANATSTNVALCLKHYAENDSLASMQSPAQVIGPGIERHLEWTVPDLGGLPIAAVGLVVQPVHSAESTIYLDYLHWSGTPTVLFRRPNGIGTMWRRAWIDAVDHFGHRWPEAFHLSQNRGTGLLIQSGTDWRNYRIQATIRPRLATRFGIAVRVRGLRRYYAIVLGKGGSLTWIKQNDYTCRELARTQLEWVPEESYRFDLRIEERLLRALVNDIELLAEDIGNSLTSGGFAFLCEEGAIMSDEISIAPLEQ
jgi:ADP-ribosylglycohydrolase